MLDWTEAHLSPPAPNTTPAERVSQGCSVATVHEFATSAEIAALRCAAADAACGTEPAARVRLHVPKRLDAAAQAVSDELVRRARKFAAAELPSLAAAVGRGQICFADHEPAVNRYSIGGEFRPHEDGQALTVLVPLSNAGCEHEGGGTSFWSDEDRGTTMARSSDSPTLVLHPPAGTALLFAGGVTHAGRPVTAGVRLVFVASFSAAPGGGTVGVPAASVSDDAASAAGTDDFAPIFSEF